jgi:hypothetical protein
MGTMHGSTAVGAIGALPSRHASSLQLLRRGASGALVVSVGGTGVSFLATW